MNLVIIYNGKESKAVHLKRTQYCKSTMGVCAQSCPTFCNPMDYSSPGSFVHGILQTRMPEWVAISYSRGSSQPIDWTHVSCISCLDQIIILSGFVPQSGIAGSYDNCMFSFWTSWSFNLLYTHFSFSLLWQTICRSLLYTLAPYHVLKRQR